MKKNTVKMTAVTAMFCALSFVAVLLGKVIPNVAGFLSYDPKDAVIAIAGFVFGPMITLLVSGIVSLVEMITISTTGIYGMIMNFLSTAFFAFPAALVYQKMKTYRGAVFGLVLGVVFMTGSMVLWNYLVTPFYMLVEREVVAGMLVPVFLPFNAIKGGLNAALTLLLYKPLVTALRKTRLVPSSSRSEDQKPYRWVFPIIGLLLLSAFVLLFLFFSGVI